MFRTLYQIFQALVFWIFAQYSQPLPFHMAVRQMMATMKLPKLGDVAADFQQQWLRLSMIRCLLPSPGLWEYGMGDAVVSFYPPHLPDTAASTQLSNVP
jgi:hypothetical protein